MEERVNITTEKTEEQLEKGSKISFFKIAVIILLSFNLLLTAAVFFYNETPASDVQSTLAEQKALSDYHKQLGKESFKLINDSVFTTTYGSKSIKGTLVNTSDKSFESVTLKFAVYENGVCVDTASAYISYCEPGSRMEFDAGVYCDSFDEYQLKYISAYEN